MSLILNRITSKVKLLTCHLYNRRRYCKRNELDKVRIDVLNKNQNMGLLINSYTQIGFRLNNGVLVMGSIAIFPRSVLSWQVTNYNEITEESLSLFTILEPKLEIIILGIETTPNDYSFKNKILSIMKKYKINIEILPTEKATSTFNYLNSESRYVAGAMIPPLHVDLFDKEYSREKQRKYSIYEASDD